MIASQRQHILTKDRSRKRTNGRKKEDQKITGAVFREGAPLNQTVFCARTRDRIANKHRPEKPKKNTTEDRERDGGQEGGMGESVQNFNRAQWECEEETHTHNFLRRIKGSDSRGDM